jgi:predicted dithiol-disulfide oxidoreductase (DUF899 family)
MGNLIMSTSTFARPRVVSREEWLAERTALLEREKANPRDRNALATQRRALPMVKMEKSYIFDTDQGPKPLAALFDGRPQLIVYHFMFHRETGLGCSGCSHTVDNLPHLAHLHARGTTLVLVSRATLAEIAPFKARMGWTVPWHSSFGTDFNYDFHVTLDESVAPIEYNYRDKATMDRVGQGEHLKGEVPGVSVFLREGEDVFHTYSAYGRGMDAQLTTYQYLDLTPFGRGEGWGGMTDLDGKGMNWLRHHDRYDT